MTDALLEVDLGHGWVTTMTQREVRDLIERLGRIVGDAAPAAPPADGMFAGIVADAAPAAPPADGMFAGIVADAAPAPPRAIDDGMIGGFIRDYTSPRRFGFVRRDDGEPDCFFHRSAIKEPACDEDIRPGRRVRFVVGTDREHEGRPRVTRLVLT